MSQRQPVNTAGNKLRKEYDQNTQEDSSRRQPANNVNNPRRHGSHNQHTREDTPQGRSESQGGRNSRQNSARGSGLYCHFYNNGGECPYESETSSCRFVHRFSKNCRDDGKCIRRMCSFQHYNQSFLDQGTGTRDRDVRPVFYNQELGGYQARQRSRNW